MSSLQRSISSSVLTAAFGLSLATSAAAQCTYTWPTSFGAGCNELVSALVVDAQGDLVAGGAFTTAGGVAADYIARWDGAAWNTLGAGMDGAVNALVRMPNGLLVAGGRFETAGGVTVNQVAYWDGLVWSALGSGIDQLLPFGSTVTSMVVDAGGQLVVAGSFASASGTACANIARWNGFAWTPLGAGVNGIVRDLCVMPNGDLVVCGSFTSAGGAPANHVARWDGSSWSALGSGIGLFGANAVTALPNGDLICGGAFATAGGVAAPFLARWNGVSWSAIGAGANGPVGALQTLENGDVLVGGSFTSIGGVAANRVALWDTTAFRAFGSGCDDTVVAFARMPDGRMAVGGAMSSAGGAAVANIAQVDSTCGSATAVVGSGCTGAGGPNVLEATNAPTIGALFSARATGMPPLAFVMIVTGLSQVSLPLDVVFSYAGPGCTLFASAEDVGLGLPSGGVATSTLPLPNTTAILGAELWHQYVPIEINGLLQFQEMTATNALKLTLGAF